MNFSTIHVKYTSSENSAADNEVPFDDKEAKNCKNIFAQKKKPQKMTSDFRLSN